MRSRYNILWLDDAFIKPKGIGNDIFSIKKKIEDYVESLGYIPNVISVSSREEVQEKLKTNPKIDIVFSDYSIDENYKGMDFLKEIRKKYLQEMMLYSNVDESEIKEYLIQSIKSNELELQMLSKFIFQSMSNRLVLIKSMKSLIDLTLIRWQELNALRGFCLAETSQMEEEAKIILSSVSNYDGFKKRLTNNHSKLLDESKSRCKKLIDKISGNELSINALSLFDFQLMLYDAGTDEFNEFDYIRKLRNGFAHTKEDTTNDLENYIELKDGTQIFEKDIKTIRLKILNVFDKFQQKLYQYQLVCNN